jgi:hypothetical protein
MRVWVRLEEYWNDCTESGLELEPFCKLCPCEFPDDGRDDNIIRVEQLVWVVQECEHIKADEDIPGGQACDFIHRQFIELSPYDNQPFWEET